MNSTARLASTFPHRLAGHCGPGALRDLLEFHRLDFGDGPLSEGSAYGLTGVDAAVNTGAADPHTAYGTGSPEKETRSTWHAGNRRHGDRDHRRRRSRQPNHQERQMSTTSREPLEGIA